MLFHRQDLKDIIFEVSLEKNLEYDKLFEEQWNKYVTTNELEERDIAIQEWFEDAGFDKQTETLFSDIMDRDKYIWKHHKESNHELLVELNNVNSRKKELENMLLN